MTLGKDDIGNGVCFVLAWAASLPALAPISSLRCSCISFDISVTYLFNPFLFITQEMRSVAKQGVDSDLNSVTALVVTDCYLQYWTDLRVSTDPFFYFG